MNGAVYISFFQGQLESVLEQVVQLAVQELGRTVGSSLSALLLEAAVTEQDNQRLRLRLHPREGGGGDGDGAGDGRSPLLPPPPPRPGKAGSGEADSGGTKPGQNAHNPGRGAERGSVADTGRLEQKGRVVGQLKSVMERVLNFAVCELTKIVEASFDDLLLEITKKEREHQALEESLGRSAERAGGATAAGEKGGRMAAGRRRGSENDSASPSGSEGTREELGDVTVSKETPEGDDPERPAVLSVSHDWVPILDKVFGQKWCSDVWQVKELEVGGVRGPVAGDGGLNAVELRPLYLEPSPTSPQHGPRWTPLEDMEVLSPEEESPVEGLGAALSPADVLRRHTPASMLQRLLTLPAQLLEEDGEDKAAAAAVLAATLAEAAVAAAAAAAARPPAESCTPTTGEEGGGGEEQQEDGEEEQAGDKGRKKKRRRSWLECDECGRRFSRASLLKSHRQTHAADPVAMETAPSPSRPSPSPWSASECGKRFSSTTRPRGHVRTHHPDPDPGPGARPGRTAPGDQDWNKPSEWN